MTTGSKTYIQNNFYGNSGYGFNNNFVSGGCCNTGYNLSCFGFGFPPRPQVHHKPKHHYVNREIPSSLQWTLGIGFGAALIGSAIKAFSK